MYNQSTEANNLLITPSERTQIVYFCFRMTKNADVAEDLTQEKLLIAVNSIAGLAIAPINPLLHTVMQERLPIEMRARVFGTMSAGFLAGIPIGTFASGYIVSWLGLRTTILIMGILYLFATLSLLVNPALKGMEN